MFSDVEEHEGYGPRQKGLIGLTAPALVLPADHVRNADVFETFETELEAEA